MGDSSSFSSLFALVDNHLSKSNVQQEDEKPSSSGISPFRLPKGVSDGGLSSPFTKLPIPRLSLSENPLHDILGKQSNQEDGNDKSTMRGTDRTIHDVLSMQLSNMFKAREAKEEEERRKQELKNAEKSLQKLKLEESNCLIDLMPAVQRCGQVIPQDEEALSSGSSMESVLMPDILAEDEPLAEATLDILPRPESPKPILQDISYMLKHKIGKCSEFGKVLCARYRPVAAPYIRTRVPHNIKVFDFSTPSPDDLILEKLKKPSFYGGGSNNLMVFE